MNSWSYLILQYICAEQTVAGGQIHFTAIQNSLVTNQSSLHL